MGLTIVKISSTMTAMNNQLYTDDDVRDALIERHIAGGMSGVEIGRAAGMSASAVSLALSGRQSPGPTLARWLGFTPIRGYVRADTGAGEVGGDG